MKPVTLTILVLCFLSTFCPPAWATGLQFFMNRTEHQLLCVMDTDLADKSSLVDISITELSEPKGTFILASASICQEGVYVQSERNLSVDVTGSISQHQAKLDIRFNTERGWQLGAYLCEITFRNSEGHLNRKHEILEAKIPNVIRSKQADFSDVMFSAQVKELQDTFAQTVNLVKNLSHGFEERLVNLINRMESFEQSLPNTTLLPNNCHQEKEVSEGAKTIAFSAGVTGNKNLAVDNIVIYDKVFSNVGNGYDQYTGIFTAPVNGIYTCTITGFAGEDKEFWLKMYQKRVSAESARYLVSVYGKTPYYSSASNTVVQELQEGDQVYIQVVRASELYNGGEVYNTFSCVLQAPAHHFLHG